MEHTAEHTCHKNIPKEERTQDKLQAHHANVFLIACMDFRFHQDISKFMKEKGYSVNYDEFILAGASLGLIQDKMPYWGQACLDHIDISVNLHQIKKIVIMDHMDCGAYKKFCPEIKTPEEEVEAHKANVAKAVEFLKSKYPNLKYKGMLMKMTGEVDEIFSECKCKEKEAAVENECEHKQNEVEKEPEPSV